MVDIRPNALPDAILPLRTGDELIVDQGSDGVRKVDPFALADSTAPIATQSEAQVGTDNTKRMTPLRTKQSIASEVGVTLASNAQGAKADSAVQSVNGKTGSSVTIVKGDVGLGNVDNTSDADKPISTATQAALDLKANSSVTISAGAGLDGGGNLTANRTVSLNAASIASLAKADSAVQSVNGVLPVSGNVTVSAEEKRLQDTRTTAIAESFGSNVLFVETAGYSSVGDGGGALYKRVSSEPTHAGKFQSADGAWGELAEEVPDVKMFGARGDGVANDSPAFQAAYNFMKVKGGGSVTVTATSSFYKVLETITYDNTINFHLVGNGRPLIQDESTDGSNTFQIGNGIHSQNQTKMSNLRIWGAVTPLNGNGLNCSYAGSLRLEGVGLYRHKGLGIYANNCWTLSATGCSVVGCLNGGVYLSGATGNGAVWTDCTFNDTPVGKVAFNVEGTSGPLPDGPHFGLTFITCRFEFNDYGLIAQYAHALNLIGCYFEFNTTNAFRIQTGCDGVNIHGNSIFTSPGLVLGANNIDIRGNKAEFDGNIEVGDSTNVCWGPNGIENKANIIFGTTRNMEYEAFPEWVTYNSTWISSGTQPALGNGTLLFKYKRRGNTVQCSVVLTMGSTSTYGSIGYGFNLPFNVAAGVSYIGKAGYYDASSNATVMQMTAVCEPGNNYVALRNDGGGVVGPTSPITFAEGDKIYASFTYECVS